MGQNSQCQAPECQLTRAQHDDAGDVGHAFKAGPTPEETGKLIDVVREAINDTLTCYSNELERAATTVVGAILAKYNLTPIETDSNDAG